MRTTTYGAIALGIGLLAGTVQASTTHVWTGNGSSQTNWADANNWNPVSEPTAGTGSYGDELRFNTTNNYAIFDGYDAVEANNTNSFTIGVSYYKQIRVGLGTPGRLDVKSGKLDGDDSGTSHIVGESSSGEVNVSGGILYIGAATSYIGNKSGGSGVVNISGTGTYVLGRESGGISGYVGMNAANGEINITGGTFKTRGGLVLGGTGGSGLGIGLFHVAGTNASEIGIGSESSVNGSWQQNAGSTLKIGIDATSLEGVTPILIDDVSTNFPAGNATATFENGALLEPYFVGGIPVAGKWAVMKVEGSITDNGVAFSSNVTDTNWSFTIVSNNTLEIWYGLGDSGYTNNPPPPIYYSAGTVEWDGEAGDHAWDNPTNWVSVTNNVLPLQGTGSAGAELRFNTTNGFAVYSVDEGSRYYKAVRIGNSSDGRLDVTGGTLIGDDTTSHIVGESHAGTLNVSGGTIRVGASTSYIGNKSGATGIVNVNGGTYIWGRDSGGTSGYIGASSGYGEINVSSGTFQTRGGVVLGDSGGTGVFSVLGSTATDIGIGSYQSVDGAWTQNSGSTLKARIDAGGVTPIQVVQKDNTPGSGGDGNVTFDSGSLLDVGWMPGVTNWGSFAVMTADGTMTDNGLQFAPGVDTNNWSFYITNNTLYVESGYGNETYSGTPYWWLDQYFQVNGANPYGFVDYTDAAYSDTDGDGLLAWEEYQQGSDPTNPNDPTVQPFSILPSPAATSNMVITWESYVGLNYDIQTKSDLTDTNAWGTLVSGIPGKAGSTSYTSTVSGAASFFKVVVP